MKVIIFYRPDSEQARSVEEFIHEFGRRYPGAELKAVNIDTVGGSEQCRVYDVVQYPTTIATADDGSELQRWNNGLMPLMSEVAYYTNQ